MYTINKREDQDPQENLKLDRVSNIPYIFKTVSTKLNMVHLAIHKLINANLLFKENKI